MTKLIFTEKQSAYQQPWILLITILCLGTFYALLLYQVISGNPVGNNPLPNMGFLVVLIITTALFVALLNVRLELRMDEHGVHYRFWPFVNRWVHLEWNELENIKVRKYRPLLEYGGWGYRISAKGKAYTLGGKTGVQMSMKSGKNLLIGVRDAESAGRVIAGYFPVDNSYD